MTVYNSPQGDGIFLVFKFKDDELDTGSYTGSYRYKGPARVYNTAGKAKAQWTRYQRDGYSARVAEVRIDPQTAGILATWISGEWLLKPELCKRRCRSATSIYTNSQGKTINLPHYETCYRRKGHGGIHWSGREAKKDPDYDPETVLKETTDA